MFNQMKVIIVFLLITGVGFASTGFTFSAPDTNENDPAASVTFSLDDFFTAANTFLSAYVADGKVDYAGIKSEQSSIQKLTDAIASADLSAAGQNTKIAFYLNAYNLLVIKSVVDKLPINSPLDVPGFFDTKKHNVAGEYLTLNDIENKKLRPDPRVHFALVCAARGCPKIINEAYMPSTVQDQLTRQTKKAMNDASFIKVDNTAKTVKISKIFDWYKDDFLKQPGTTALTFINQYRDVKIPADYSLGYYEYDWSLNKK
jgi:hypothetical protein